jgi:hypothetical protein
MLLNQDGMAVVQSLTVTEKLKLVIPFALAFGSVSDPETEETFGPDITKAPGIAARPGVPNGFARVVPTTLT